MVTESDLVADQFAKLCVQFVGQSCSNTSCRQSPRLCVTDHRFAAQAGFQAELWQLRTFSASRFAANHNDLSITDQLNEFVTIRTDGQFVGIFQLWLRCFAFVALGDRFGQFGFEFFRRQFLFQPS